MDRLLTLDIVALALGVLAGAGFSGPAWVAAIGCVASLFGRVRFGRVSMVAALGFFLAAMSAAPPVVRPFLHKSDVLLRGRVIDGPRKLGSTYAYVVALTRVDDQAAAFGVRFYLDTERVFAGELEAWSRCGPLAPAEFPGVRAAEDRWAVRGVRASCRALGEVRDRPSSSTEARARAWLTQRRLGVEQTLVASLGRRAGVPIAMLTGTRGYLWPSEVRAHQRAGTAHLLAISGLHFGALAAIVWTLASLIFRRIPAITRRIGARRASAGFVLVIMFAYLILVGAPVSAMRAYVACAVVALSALLGRRPSGIAAASLAVVALVLASPEIIADLGFQLSFVATVAIVLFWERRPGWLDVAYLFQESSLARRLRAVASFVLMSWVATAVTAPLIVGATGELSCIAMLTNLIAVPVVSLIVFPMLVLGIALSGLLPTMADGLLQLAAELMLRLTLLVDCAASGNIAVVTTGTPHLWWVGCAVVSVLVAVTDRLRLRSVALAVAVFAMLPLATPAPPSGARVHFIPVGQGDATLVETADGRSVLVDAGGALRGLDPGRAIVAPYLRRLGFDRLDAVIVTHPDTDHAQGVPGVLDEMGATQVIIEPTDSMPEFQIDRVVANGSKNDRSLIVRFEAAGTTTLLTGDVEAAGEAGWNEADGRPIDILKVPHHGSNTSSSLDFLRATRPTLAVVSAGRENRFGHPTEAVMARYRSEGIPLFSTSEHGLIIAEIRDSGEILLFVRRP